MNIENITQRITIGGENFYFDEVQGQQGVLRLITGGLPPQHEKVLEEMTDNVTPFDAPIVDSSLIYTQCFIKEYQDEHFVTYGSIIRLYTDVK